MRIIKDDVVQSYWKLDWYHVSSPYHELAISSLGIYHKRRHIWVKSILEELFTAIVFIIISKQPKHLVKGHRAVKLWYSHSLKRKTVV